MAKTLYGYQDRRGANQVDWNSLTTDASDSLRKIQSGREQKKQELDDINQSLLTAANDVEMGQNQTFNQFVLDGSNQTKEFLLMQNRLLKKGLLNPNDYNRAMQTVKDDWASFGQSTKKFNETYDEAFKRLNDGTMAGEEAFKKEMLFKFGNVQDKGVFVNPVDGRLYLAEKDKNGKIITDPDKLVNVAALNDMMNEKIQKIDVQGEVAKGADKMADIIKVLRKNNVLTLKDARQNPMYKKSKEDFISSILTNPKNQASILADYLGGYEFTYDKSKAGGNTIYLQRDGGGIGQPKLTKEQEKIARETLDAAFESQIEQIEKEMPIFAPQRPLAGGGNDDKDMLEAYRNALEIAAGTPNAAGFVQAITRNPNSIVSNIVATPNEILVEMKDGQEQKISRIGADGNQIPVDQVAQAIMSYLDPRATPAKAADIAGKFRQRFGSPLPGQIGNFGAPTFKTIDDVNAVVNKDGKYVPASLRDAIIAIEPSGNAHLQIQALASKLDPNITVAPGSDKKRVIISYGDEVSEEFPISSEEDRGYVSEYINKLHEYIFKKTQATPAATAAPAQKSGLMSKY